MGKAGRGRFLLGVSVILAAALAAAAQQAAAQQAAAPVVGYLSMGSASERGHMVDWFRDGLKAGGFAEGKNVAIVYRWAEGRDAELPRLAADLVNRKVAAIVTSGGTKTALAAKAATSTIPIVILTSTDPVGMGLVASLARPGGNVTGVANLATQLEIKRLQILRDLLPAARKVVYLANPDAPDADASTKEVAAAAKRTGMQFEILRARSESELEAAFARLKPGRASVLLVATNGLFTTRREQIAGLAAKRAIADCYSRPEFVVAGGLMSYGPDYADVYRQVGGYTARILKGAKPADLPVIQEMKFNLVLNLAAAKRLGITVSRDFLARVDEIVE